MARRRSNRVARDRNRIARRLPVRLRPLSVPVLPALSDLRRFHPQRLARPLFSLTVGARSIVVPAIPPRGIPARVVVAAPRKVAVCVRRQRRKEVLFAKGVGGSKVRRGRRTSTSDVRCK